MEKIYKPGQLLTFIVEGTKYIVRLKKRERANNACNLCCFSSKAMRAANFNKYTKEYFTIECRAAPMACAENLSYYYELVKTIKEYDRT